MPVEPDKINEIKVYEMIKAGTLTLDQFRDWLEIQTETAYNNGIDTGSSELYDPLDE